MENRRKRRLAKFFSLPVLALCGFLIAATLAGVGLATDTTSTDSSSTISSTTTPTTTPPAREGCTPGFWKNHPEDWDRFAPTDKIGDVFTEAPEPIASMTLMQGLNLGGGGLKALTRHAIAGLLSAADLIVDYPLTVQGAIDLGNAGYSDPSMTGSIKNLFEGLNEAGCPL